MIHAFFSKQKSSETSDSEVDEQSESRLSSSDTVIDFTEQSRSRPLASTSSAESQFTHVTESETQTLYLHVHYVLKNKKKAS